MYKILAFLILIPTLCHADYMVYVKATPEALYRKLQGPTCGVNADGTMMDQPILIADPEGTDKSFWAALVSTEQLAVLRTKPSFLGKGLTEVKASFPGAYRKMVNWTWELKTDTMKKFTTTMSDNTYQVGTLYRKVNEDQPIQTFFGYDPFTGDPK